MQAMEELQLKRYIVTTGLMVDTPFDTKGKAAEEASQWMRSHYPVSTADKQTEYGLLAASHLDWTLVRLPIIELTDKRYPIQVSLFDCRGQKISAADLACFLIDQLSDRSYYQQAPFLSNV